MKKYLVVGGFVNSSYDGDRHYINARKLCNLYKLQHNECWLIEEKDFINERQLESFKGEDLILLRPRYDGNYTLTPTAEGW